MRIASYLFVVLALAGCGMQPKIVMLGRPDREYEPVPLEDVWVFASQDRVRAKHQPIAEIAVRQTSWDEGIPADENLLYQLKEQAGKVGGHGIVLGQFEDTSRLGVFEVPMASGVATAIRFLEPDLGEARAAAKSPRDVDTIVVASLALPEDLPVHDTIVRGFVRDIYSELESAGYHPLPYETWESAWAEVGPEPEGLLDPTTGLKNEGYSSSMEQKILRSLIDDYGADGFLFPDIQGVQARFWGDEAKWDGIKQKVGETRSTGAKVVSGIANLLLSGEEDFEEPDPTGTVWALSLVVAIENALRAHLYEGRGGIELLEGADFEGGIYIGDQEPEEYEIFQVPDELLFQKQSRLQRAVRIAFEPLAQGRWN